MQQQIDSLQEYNKVLQKTIQEIGNNVDEAPKSDEPANSKRKSEHQHQRLSELLISDKLIHEENTKVISELREAGHLKDQEIARLKKALEESDKSKTELEQKNKC